MRYESKRDYQKNVSSDCQRNLHYDVHFHQSVEFNYLVEGEGVIIRVLDKEEIFKKGEISFIPSLVPHSVETIGDSVEENLIIPLRYIENIYNKNGNTFNFFSMKNLKLNEKLFTEINEIKSLINSPYSNLLQAHIDVLFFTILKEYSYLQNEPVSKNFNIAIQIINYINDNFQSDLTLIEVAKVFGYNKNYFSKLFSTTFHCNFRTYLNRIRITYIEQEIKRAGNERKIIDIIHEAGFNDVSSYYRAKRKDDNYGLHAY